MTTQGKVSVYVFCGGCGKEIDASCYPEGCCLCEACKIEQENSASSSTFPPTFQHNMSSFNITPEQVKAHRASRKTAGMAGCITGRPVPPMDFFGYKDVQSWRPADPMKPHCFCFDCRDLWDNDASIDVKLIQEGHKMAVWTYAELLPKESRPVMEEVSEAQPRPSLALPMRSNSGGIAPPPASPVLPKRSNGGGIALLPRNGGAGEVPPLRIDTSVDAYDDFDDVPSSLPAPRHRDVLNEPPSLRLRNDLAELRMRIQSKLVYVMDKKRRAPYFEGEERALFLAKVNEEEHDLWAKLDAIEVLLKE